VPTLLERYTQADPVVRAVIDVAIDARRLGHPVPIPHALLERAAPGYLTDHDWDSAGDDWLERAFAYTAKPCRGVPGPLTRIRPRAGQPSAGQPHYRLADHLEQTGRIDRAGTFPPGAFWNAAAQAVIDPGILRELASQAERRGRYARAAQLYKQAADHGDTDAMRDLAWRRGLAGDATSAETLVRQAADRGNPIGLREFALLRQTADTQLQPDANSRAAVATWDRIGRWAADGEAAGAETLLQWITDRNTRDGLLALFTQFNAENLDQETEALRDLALAQAAAGDYVGAENLVWQAADSDMLRDLARLRVAAGDDVGAETLLRHAVDRGLPGALRWLVELRERAGDRIGAGCIARLGLTDDGYPATSLEPG
jgi:hypothetical protein